MIPLILKLKKASHKEMAITQDLIIYELYNIFDKAVLHGGTSIWRCYNGNRFSEDIDVYLLKDVDRINMFFEILKKKGFVIIKKKIGERSLFSELRLNRTNVRFEVVFKKINGILKEYRTVDENLVTVYTLSPEDLIKEKIRAYLERYKVRDIYDIFFLLRYVNKKESIKKELEFLINKFKMPSDKKELKVLIIEGLVPDLENMLDYIKNWVG